MKNILTQNLEPKKLAAYLKKDYFKWEAGLELY